MPGVRFRCHLAVDFPRVGGRPFHWRMAVAAAGVFLLLFPRMNFASELALKPGDVHVQVAIEALRQALQTEQGSIRLHAAEKLIAAGQGEEVRGVFERDLPGAERTPIVRIGLWRALAAAARTPGEREQYVEKISAVFLGPENPDRVHALESLCKLGVQAKGPLLEAIRQMATGPSEDFAPFAWWALHLAGDKSARTHLAAALQSTSWVARLRGAYALRWIGVTDDAAILTALARAADREPADSKAAPYVKGSAFALNADSRRMLAWGLELEAVLDSGVDDARYEVCHTLVRAMTSADVDRLQARLEHAKGDERVGLAWAILALSSKP